MSTDYCKPEEICTHPETIDIGDSEHMELVCTHCGSQDTGMKIYHPTFLGGHWDTQETYDSHLERQMDEMRAN